MEKTFNKYELENFAKIASNAYLENGTDLNETITNLAKENGFTRHHVDRVAQTANTIVNGTIVKQARADNRDPRLKFDLASGEKIASMIESGARREKTAAYAGIEDGLYSVTPESQDMGQVIDGVFGAQANDPFADHAQSVDVMDLTAAYVREPQVVEKVAERLDSRSIGLSHRDLQLLESRARSQHNADKLAMDAVSSQMAEEIELQILNGESPATIRDVVKRASLNENMKSVIDDMVTGVAAAIGGVREGQSKLAAHDIVNAEHALFKGAEDMAKAAEAATESAKGLERFTASRKLAELHLNRATRAGR